jgi:hypothetical protein
MHLKLMEKLVVTDVEAATLRQRHADVVLEMIATCDAMVAAGATTQLMLVSHKLQLLRKVNLTDLTNYLQKAAATPIQEEVPHIFTNDESTT